MPSEFIASLLLEKQEISRLLAEVDPSNSAESNKFFDRFGLNNLVANGNYAQALHMGRGVLELVQNLDKVKYIQMHKGGTYYWMGMAAYFLADFQTAIYLMDAAVSEDVKNSPASANTPARLLFRLEGSNPNQAAQKLTEDAEKQLLKLINEYNKIIEAHTLSFDHLDLNSLRRRILEPATLSKDPGFRSLASTLITFFIEFDYRFDLLKIRPELGTNEPFFFHLIKGCLLFETILKKNPSVPITQSTLGAALMQKPIKQKLGLPESFDIGSRSLKSVLENVVNVDDHPASAIIFTGKLRNALAHDLGWPDQLSKEDYVSGFFLIAMACLHIIGVLFKD